jgi:glycosyltransferase involved in cell wall biosynthesis
MNRDSARILFVCSALGTGGAERQWSILLPRLAERGFEPQVLTLAGRGRFFDEIRGAGIPADCADMRNRYDLRRAWQAFARVRQQQQPDLVVTQETNAHLVGHVIARHAKVGHVAVDHTPRGLPRSLHRRLLTGLIARRVDRAVGVSRSQVPDLIDLGFPQSNLRIIYNGVPALKPTQDADSTRASLGVVDGEVVALLVAALRPQKRVPFFIAAVVAANAIDSRIRGFIAGGGPELEHVRTLADNSGAVVRALGERDDIANLMQAADVLCLTSWTEGLPMVLLEAMSLGCAILATDVSGVDEVIIHEETGLLARGTDVLGFSKSLCRLAQNPNEARVLGNAARARYEREFTADRMTEEYAELFKSVLARSRSNQS